MISSISEKNVFINCPFDDEYLRLLRPLIFTLLTIGYTPRIAKERLDSGEPRFRKICELISESQYGIHDLSRVQAKRKGEYLRLNMPFELGLDIGCRVFSQSKYSAKRCLILEEKRYRCKAALSDLSNSDTKSHGNEPTRIVRQIRNWFVENGLKNALSPTKIWYLFTDFMADFYREREEEGFNADDIYEMPISEFIDYINIWLKNRSF